MRAHTIGFVLLLAACPKSDPASTPPDAPVDTPAQVCCESFGYGAQMVKCCESYAWTAPDACVVSPELVGGGKAVVDDARCAAAK